jgi:hypothetical protein
MALDVYTSVDDVKMKDVLEEKNDFAGRFYYNFSVLLCLPQSMAYHDSEATGAGYDSFNFQKICKRSGILKN